MPATHTVSIASKIPQYTVLRNDIEEPVTILKNDSELDRVYVNYINHEKRFDEWVSRSQLNTIAGPSTVPRKRKRRTPASTADNRSIHSEDGRGSEQENGDQEVAGDEGPREVVMTEEDYDLQFHKQIGAVRNFEKVHFGEYLIRTWYFSPYPITENQRDEDAEPVSASNSTVARMHGTSHPRGRASDLFAGEAYKHSNFPGNILWVCDMCFKYMTDGPTWESHKKICSLSHPPGEKVYQRGAHIIWEVDGAKEKLYCQNLSLFGKLFIDIKTLYFDLDNFMFYILTDAATVKDHMLGYFCKEKQSFDDYNLACITTLPPYQKQGYGMLMIEFSYELSRRAGKAGTPERPLSDLGLRSYMAYWIATLIRFFRKVLSVLPPGTSKLITTGAAPDFARSHEGSEDGALSPTVTRKRKKPYKGWEGEVSSNEDPGLPLDDAINSVRNFITVANPDGSASTHLTAICNLKEIARATNLRVEDAAFALNEMGMLKRWANPPPPSSQSSGVNSPPSNGNSSRRSASVATGGGGGVFGGVGTENETGDIYDQFVILISRELVEKVAEERRVKPPCMQMQYVILPS